jgi:glycosyltransferase involved in cell wall biosynthesis
MSNIEISIIIAARNMERFIGETLASVLKEQVPSREIIVVDDGSTDLTAQIAHNTGDPRLRVLARARDHGVSAARNAGVAHAQGRTILFLDADDLMIAGSLQRLLSRLDDVPNAVAAFGSYLPVSESGAPLADRPSRISIFPAADTLRHLLAKNFIVNGGALLIRADALRRAGAFETGIAFGEDWELWCRLAALGDFAPLEGDAVLQYRQRAAGANRSKRGSPVKTNDAAIVSAYSRPEIRAKFTDRELASLERKVRIDTYWAGVRNELSYGSLPRFAAYAALGAVRFPDSILRPRLALRFLGTLARNWRPS